MSGKKPTWSRRIRTRLLTIEGPLTCVESVTSLSDLNAPPAAREKRDKRDRPVQNGLVPLFGEKNQRDESSGTVGQSPVICGARKTPPEPAPSGTLGGSRTPNDTPPLTDGVASDTSTGDGFTFLTQAIETYRRALMAEGGSPSTALQYGRHLHAFAEFLRFFPEPPLSLPDITSDHVTAFRDHEIAREKRGHGPGLLSARSVQGIVKALRGFFKHLMRRGLVLFDPALDLKGPRVPFRLPRNIPTARQMRRLLASPDTKTAVGKRDRAILELLYGAGLRSAELCGLLLGDVNLDSRTVFVRKGKGSKDRIVPLGKSAAKAVKEYTGVYSQLSRGKALHEGLPLFLAVTGRQIGRHNLKKQLDKYLRMAGLSSLKATPHSLRHACATHLLKGGADIRQIQALLGHASITATQIYTKVETSDLLRMLDRHHPRSWSEEEG